LAVGGAGLTYLAREIDAYGSAIEPDLAIKVLYTSRAEGSFLRRLSNEAQILQELDHDNIVTCMGFVQRVGTEPYLVTLFEKGGNLQGFIERSGPVSPRVAAGILLQVLLALDVAHQRGVVHRDLKPDNVLLREIVPQNTVPHVRLTDFGIAKISGGLSSQLTQHGSFVGTPEYAAPEQFRGKDATAATDVFATGGLLLYLLTGRPPFAFQQRTDITAAYKEVLAALPPRLEHVDGSASELKVLQTVIDHTMIDDPKKRWTIYQVITRLRQLHDSSSNPRTLETTEQPAPGRQLGAPAPSALSSATTTFTVEETREEEHERMPSQATHTEERSSARGGVIGLLFGGVAGMFMVWVLGGGMSLAALAMGGWLFGWLESNQLPMAALDVWTVDLELATDLTTAARLLGATDAPSVSARREMTQALDVLGTEIGKTCVAKGAVVGTMLLRADGGIGQVTLDDGYLGDKQTSCVRAALLGRALPNALARPVMLRTAFEVKH